MRPDLQPGPYEEEQHYGQGHHDSLVVAALGKGDFGPCSGWRNLIVV